MSRSTFFFCLMVLMAPFAASAQLIITEIMYDLSEGSDSGREWIEVHNTGTSAIPLTKWSVRENNKNHSIAALPGGISTLEAGSYAIIADNPQKFVSDHPGLEVPILDSAFALNNTGETIALFLGSVAGDSVMYTSSLGAHGSGDSLQRGPGFDSFAPGRPTPGRPIPPEGLSVTPTKKKEATKKSTSRSVAQPARVHEIVRAPSDPIKKEPTDTALSQAAAVSMIATQPTSHGLWYAAVFALALFGASGIALAKHAKKSEWEIIEETDETS